VRVSELGEFGLIQRLTAGLATRADVLLAAGDDAALLNPGPDAVLVATIDAQVEGQHFLRSVASWAEIGHKALAVNLSDIAAMGAEPLWALVSLILPPSIDVDVLDGIYAGLQALAARYDVAIVGGNVAATDGPLTLDIAVLGRVRRGRALVRSGGRPGDPLLVTGTLGAAAAGVLLATHAMPGGKRLSRSVRARVRQAMVAPAPRVAEGRALAAASVVTAMLDVSDGLAGDLRHLCAASGVGAVLDASTIPVDAAAASVANAYGRDPLRLALTGGEDYELLASVRPDRVQRALDAVAHAGGEARIIGELTGDEGNISLRLPDSTLRPLLEGGWDHLRRRTDNVNPAS
jgi:thiamine-monophosphate kinase